MNNFIKKLIYFSFLFCFSIVLIFLIWISLNYPKIDIPAPNLSNSYSFNEKMLFMNEKNEPGNLDVLAMGSSLALNNLNSLSVTKTFKTNNFLNASSWGLDIKDNFQLLKILYDVYNPKKLILVVNLVDFQSKNIRIKYNHLKDFLLTDSQLTFHIKTFNLEYYFNNTIYSHKVRNSINDYEFLGFDTFGGVNLKSEGFNIDPDRWAGNSELGNLDIEQYFYLDSIASFCARNSINLFVFQSPFRIGYYLTLDETEKEKIFSHQKKVQSISEKYNMEYASSLETTWPDSLFLDGLHLNEMGSRLFTEYCFENITINDF